MTDKEIIKALECCNEPPSQCDDCPLSGMVGCQAKTMESALDLINRQQAEIERLQKENNQFADIGKMYSEIRAEAIKEFAERLKQKILVSPYDVNLFAPYTDNLIDNLVKEMAGEQG